ncbi:Alpha/Beta hydrolase protein [Baffinella frigidus]|nr:Alpha/Beta hydrolase protein [Cryptophyta sp. CCMP2293]
MVATDTGEGSEQTGNLARGPHFWTNRNGHKLYARAWLPSSPTATKGIITLIHGHGGHVNSAGRETFANALAAQGFAVVGYDMQGHGYSEGEHVYIEKYESLVEDQIEFLDLLDSGAQSQPGLVGLVPEGFSLSRVPLFVFGESMGGALALLIGQRLSSAAGDASTPSAGRFRGAVLSAPAIHVNLPPPPVVFFLKHVVAPLLPRTCIPAFLETVHFPELSWSSDERRAQAAADQWGRPGAIGWGHTMRFGCAAALLQMTLDTQTLLPAIAFPFLVLHDPQDGITPFAGLVTS